MKLIIPYVVNSSQLPYHTLTVVLMATEMILPPLVVLMARDDTGVEEQVRQAAGPIIYGEITTKDDLTT